MARLETLITSSAIVERLDVLAGEIAEDLSGDFIVVAILTGSFIFAADLIRALATRGCQPEVDFVTLASYGGATQSSGQVRLLRDVEISVAGRQVLLMDDILDSGRTLSFARNHLLTKGARTVKLCVLLDKSAFRPGGTMDRADFVGFSCPDRFVVGYGMDFDHKYRGLNFIAALCDM